MAAQRIAALVILMAAGKELASGQATRIPPWEEAANLLATSHDQNALEKSAIVLASSNDAPALAKLGEFLRQPGFLARLDDPTNPISKTWHLQRVLASLAGHPSSATERLCLALAADP